ncbi:MAG TPA: hypothetical protein VFV12_00970 [Xanthobacteraceae bacterium]|nr:hypothetical protein [Xanthobacteraceae bacterium]
MPLRSFADVPTLSAARGAEREQDGIVFRQVCGSPAIRTRHCARPLGAARGDFHRFPPFSGEVTHEAMIGKVVF